MNAWNVPSKNRFHTAFGEAVASRKLLRSLSNGRLAASGQSPLCENHIHPFYQLNNAERGILCATENGPQLLGGKKIVPVLRSSDLGRKEVLTNARLVFKSVVGINKLLGSYHKFGEEKPLAIIADRDIDQLLRSSRLGTTQVLKLQEFSALLQEQKSPANHLQIASIVDSLNSDTHEAQVFSEEVFLYILQHFCNSKHGMISVALSIVDFLQKDIDELREAEVLLLQWLVTIRQKNVPRDQDIIEAFSNLTVAISDRFHISNCILHFSPPVTQAVLEFYLDAGLLSESKLLFTDLISKRFCVKSKLVEKYLALIEDKVTIADLNDRLLKKFAYISDFRPVFETTLTPGITEILISYCRHFDEVISLLELVERSKATRQIWDHVLPQLVRRISLLDVNPVVNSCNLTVILNRAKNFYGSALSSKVQRAFIVQYAANGNFTMVTKLIRGYEQHLNPNFYASLLSASTDSNICSSVPGFRPQEKRGFLVSMVLPHYDELSLAAKRIVLENADSEELLKPLILSELAIQARGGKALVSEAVSWAERRGLNPNVRVEVNE
ncbi:LADA_0D08944g1_1 [Lachancea dasiensis]|uniref:ATPase expression protein 1 n=1 Tax=Lachancea dasiensis TaxID=1072105 RepID=A0A1G4J7L9_9SACH|nr:LADA_0D08944g1_1 [Lachancea dasiensis]